MGMGMGARQSSNPKIVVHYLLNTISLCKFNQVLIDSTLRRSVCSTALRQSNQYDSRANPKERRRKPLSFSDINDEEDEGKARMELHRSRGQHILTNPRVLKAIVKKSGIKKTDTVLEIGPGTGNLTVELLEAANKVIAVEIDPRMIEALRKRIHGADIGSRVELLRGDVLRTELPEFDICVANIPYQISSPLIFKLLFGVPKFRHATLMFQKEFARRLLAKPGDSLFNRLAVNVRLVASVALLMDVSKKDFSPCPKVDSSLVRIEPRVSPAPVDLREWDGFTRMCFSRKNKTLGAIFRQKATIFQLMKKSDLWHDKLKLEGDHEEQDEPWPDLCVLGEVHDAEEFEVEGDVDNQKFVCLKEKVVGVLQAGGYEDKRSSKLSEHQLLGLLSMFNKAGVYFS